MRVADRAETGDVTRALFVAGRGSAETDGLHYFEKAGAGTDSTWSGRLIATVDELAALCWHPSLDIVYGISGLGRGLLHAWDVANASTGQAVVLAETDCLGDIPCDLAVSPDGRMLVVANFGLGPGLGVGSLTVWALDELGLASGEGQRVHLEGGSRVDPLKQASAHPHQIVFHEGLLYVPDFGDDTIRRFDYASGQLRELQPISAPSGSAPRHIAMLPGSRAVASAELAGAVIAGGLVGEWTALTRGSEHTGPAAGRHTRNYPSDIKASPDGTRVYLANRGYDTISTFSVDGDCPSLVAEIDSGTVWPQHLLVSGDELLVAGWDSSTVVSLPLIEGVPGEGRVLFSCPGAGWLLEGRS